MFVDDTFGVTYSPWQNIDWPLRSFHLKTFMFTYLPVSSWTPRWWVLRRVLRAGPFMVATVTPSARSTRSHGAQLTGPAGRGTHGARTHAVYSMIKQTLRETDAESMVIPSIFFPSCLFDVRYKGTLASVLSKVDMDWLWNFSGRKPFWIGGYLKISLFYYYFIYFFRIHPV